MTDTVRSDNGVERPVWFAQFDKDSPYKRSAMRWIYKKRNEDKPINEIDFWRYIVNTNKSPIECKRYAPLKNINEINTAIGVYNSYAEAKVAELEWDLQNGKINEDR